MNERDCHNCESDFLLGYLDELQLVPARKTVRMPYFIADNHRVQVRVT